MINLIDYAAELKAKDLVNQYYNHAKSQHEAIEIVERIVLTRLSQDIDSLHDHIFIRQDFDRPLIDSAIKGLKFWQEVAAELQRMKPAV
jgi:hypothetical protein